MSSSNAEVSLWIDLWQVKIEKMMQNMKCKFAQAALNISKYLPLQSKNITGLLVDTD